MRLPRPRMGWLPSGWLRPDIGFGAFISYSGPADRELISKLQNGIEKLAKRWYRPAVMKVFVDKTSIAAGTRLWSRIEYGLTRSKWLILMASPDAAQSWWVDREVGWWAEHKSLDNLIIVHTAGVLRWDRDVKDFSDDSNAIPPCLRGKFNDEPVWATVPRTGQGADVEAAVLSSRRPTPDADPRVVLAGLPGTSAHAAVGRCSDRHLVAVACRGRCVVRRRGGSETPR